MPILNQLPGWLQLADRLRVDGLCMTLIWLSPRLPADRSAIANGLGPAIEISSAEFPPAGTSVAVATVYERPLLDRLAAVPGAGVLLLLKPPGTATPLDLPFTSGPSSVVEAADVSQVTAAIQDSLTRTSALWPAVDPGAVSGPSGWLQDRPDIHPGDLSRTGELGAPELVGAGAAAGPSRPSRRHWIASGGIVGAAALAAVLVLATQGGASGTSNAGFRAPGGAQGGYGFGGFPGGLPGSGTGQNGTGSAGSGSAGSTDRAAERQAFLDCLTKNGVDTSTFTSGRRPRLDPSDPTMAKALQACVSLLPRHGDRDRDGDGTGMPPAGGMPGPGGAFGPGDTGQSGTGQSDTAPGVPGSAGSTTGRTT